VAAQRTVDASLPRGGPGAADGGEELPVHVISALLAKGKGAGTVTVDQVLVSLGSPEPTPQFIEAITELLHNNGIAVDPEEPALVEVAGAVEASRSEPPVRAGAAAVVAPVRRDVRAVPAGGASGGHRADTAAMPTRCACTSGRSVGSGC
jgi:hypothetical protein